MDKRVARFYNREDLNKINRFGEDDNNLVYEIRKEFSSENEFTSKYVGEVIFRNEVTNLDLLEIVIDRLSIEKGYINKCVLEKIQEAIIILSEGKIND